MAVQKISFVTRTPVSVMIGIPITHALIKYDICYPKTTPLSLHHSVPQTHWLHTGLDDKQTSARLAIPHPLGYNA